MIERYDRSDSLNSEYYKSLIKELDEELEPVREALRSCKEIYIGQPLGVKVKTFDKIKVEHALLKLEIR
jgi:hypothetical protein